MPCRDSNPRPSHLQSMGHSSIKEAFFNCFPHESNLVDFLYLSMWPTYDPNFRVRIPAKSKMWQGIILQLVCFTQEKQTRYLVGRTSLELMLDVLNSDSSQAIKSR